eukprot:gene2316-4508_t
MSFGVNGVFLGAGAIFFFYIGFDSVATTAEECNNSRRDLPIGIIGSLIASSIIAEIHFAVGNDFDEF